MSADTPNDNGLGPVLVTGGTGFLGRAIVERLLLQGRTVVVAGRTPAPDLEARGVRFIRAPLDDAAAVREACRGMQAVFHAAAKVGVWGRRADFFRTNVLGTRAVIDGCRIHGVAGSSTRARQASCTTAATLPASMSRCRSRRDARAPTPDKGRGRGGGACGARPGAPDGRARPHLIWGPGDPHLVPRLLARARAGRLRIVGEGTNRVDMVHIENAADAHIAAERALAGTPRPRAEKPTSSRTASRSFSGSGSTASGRPRRGARDPQDVPARGDSDRLRLRGRVEPAGVAGEPPMTRFVAAELAKDHWFDISAARRDLGYAPRISMEQGTAGLVQALRSRAVSQAK